MSARVGSALPIGLHHIVGRSRYAEERRPAASRINLHVHSSISEEVIVQPFARKRHYDCITRRTRIERAH